MNIEHKILFDLREIPIEIKQQIEHKFQFEYNNFIRKYDDNNYKWQYKINPQRNNYTHKNNNKITSKNTYKNNNKHIKNFNNNNNNNNNINNNINNNVDCKYTKFNELIILNKNPYSCLTFKASFENGT